MTHQRMHSHKSIIHTKTKEPKAWWYVCMRSNSRSPLRSPDDKMVAMQRFFIGCHIIIICSYIFLITSLQLNKMLCMYRTKSFDVHSLSLVQLLYNFQATLFKKHFYCWPAKLMMGYAHCLQWTNICPDIYIWSIVVLGT